MAAVIITGVPGVGKSTILSMAAEGTKRPIVVYGTEMFEVATKRGLAKHRDQMRLLPATVQREIQEVAAEEIARRGDVIVDTHCTIKTPKGYLPGLPEWVVKRLKPSQIILVEAPPGQIAKRRANDASRARDADDPIAIGEHQAMNRAAAIAVATLTGATVLVLENLEGQQEATRQTLLSALA